MQTRCGLFAKLRSEESGQDLVEYVFLLGLLGVGTVVATTDVTTSIRTLFNSVGATLTSFS